MSRSTHKPYGGYEYRKGTKANRSLGHRTFRHAAKQQLNTVIGFDEYHLYPQPLRRDGVVEDVEVERFG